jgi:transcription initiation factor TFIIA small subunit
MAGVFEHYRCSSVGLELQKFLDELVESGELEDDQARVISEHFDKSICNALANSVKCKAVIKGALSHYRNHDDIWSFSLKKIEVKLDNSVTIPCDDRVRIISVAKR